MISAPGIARAKAYPTSSVITAPLNMQDCVPLAERLLLRALGMPSAHQFRSVSKFGACSGSPDLRNSFAAAYERSCKKRGSLAQLQWITYSPMNID